MKASEFIVRLQEAIETYGDLRIRTSYLEIPKILLTRDMSTMTDTLVIESNDDEIEVIE